MTDMTPSNGFGQNRTQITATDAKTRPSTTGMPKRQGLYDPRNEHDGCGVGFVAHLKGQKSHQIVKDGLFMLENLTHRGAVGADPLMGDGAGILVQIPDRFFREEMAVQGITLPKAGEYAVGHIFMPQDEKLVDYFKKVIGDVIAEEGQVLIGYRDVPVDNASLSKAPEIAATEPRHVQVFVGAGREAATNAEFERRLFTLRKVISNRIYDEYEGEESNFYPVSLSSTTIVYKGMFLAYQVGAYYKDLADPRFESAVALVHQRFS
ncbi:MAG: glutamate synthase subunit alpha, partial [Shinella sp.]